ncbi:hypothetical protein HK100_004486 [Physocladia obscura]|uniref:Mitochondrial genome maintenance protein MGM101 n=1 Tax=Physocladia obscura TaxID=109957 RepID=A0AAD5SYH7_9FUNG|nr:hypothetical protein HK100_004486 [Physocladia obscura]
MHKIPHIQRVFLAKRSFAFGGTHAATGTPAVTGASAVTRFATISIRMLASTNSSSAGSSTADVTVPKPVGAKIAFEADAVPTSVDSDIHSQLSTSFAGASEKPFPAEAATVLMAPLDEADIEIKPDGLLYLPEIKYRRILNKAFGPGGWALVPRGPHTVSAKNISREFALFCLGRFAAIARGEQDYFDYEGGLATAAEGVKSNAMLRCCKDLGVASELWDPAFIRDFKAKNCSQVWAANSSGMKKLLWKRNDRSLDGPYKEQDSSSSASVGASSYAAKTYKKFT